jgi:hypothetical protein
VPVEDSGALPLSEALAPSSFAEEGHSAIFAVIAGAAEEARTLSFEALLGALDDQRLKRLASDLRLLGDELMISAAAQAGASAESSGEPGRLAEELRSSWIDLENLERRQRFRAESLRGGSAMTAAETDLASDRSSPLADPSVRSIHTDPSLKSIGGASTDIVHESQDGSSDGSSDQPSAQSIRAARPSTHGSMQENAHAAGSGAGRNLDPEAAAERLKRLRERGHDATAARALFRRGPGAAAEPGRSNNT